MKRPNRTTVLIVLLVFSVACSLPGLGRRTTAPQQAADFTPTALPQPAGTPRPDLPPALIQTDPPLGSEISPQQGITFYFSQPMQRASVEAALLVQEGVSGRFAWQDDATVTFYPQTPFTPESDLLLTIGSGAQAQNGKGMSRPVPIRFRVAGPLRVADQIPAPGTTNAAPDAPLAVTFNMPVIPLGADSATQPPAFRLEPPAQGHGEWLNTSTYAFYPDPMLLGGQTYTVILNPDLHSAADTPLAEAPTWQFSTSLPAILEVQPAAQNLLPLDGAFTLRFSQPMNPDSVAQALHLTGPGVPPLQFTWDESHTTLRITPQGLLQYDSQYTLSVDSQAQSLSGAPLAAPYSTVWRTYPRLSILPLERSTISPVSAYVRLRLSTPLGQVDNLLDYLHIEPAVEGLQAGTYGHEGMQIGLRGDFKALTRYTLTISPDLPDAWGTPLGSAVQRSFEVEALPAAIYLQSPLAWGNDFLLATPADGGLRVQAANLHEAQVDFAALPLTDFFRLQGSYNAMQGYTAALQRQTYPLDAPPDRLVERTIPLPIQRTGLYYLRIPQYSKSARVLIVTNVNLTLKRGAHEALVWATAMEDGKPLAGLPITLYDARGTPIASGKTDQQGLFQAQDLPAEENPYDNTIAVAASPGEAYFSLALSSMDSELLPWDIYTRYDAAYQTAYLYSDRPIYRPGQTVHFRAILRQAFDGRYSLPSADNVLVEILGEEGQPLATFPLPLDAFGAASGEYTLPQDTPPGYYQIHLPEVEAYLSFQVAAYRKPEFEILVQPQREAYQSGETLSAHVEVNYYFGAPVNSLPVHWALYEYPEYFSLPGYHVGPEEVNWFQWFPTDLWMPYGTAIAEGDAVTDAQGALQVETPLPESNAPRRYVLEVTASDESGFPVSGRAEIHLHPAAFYIGVRAEQWSTPAGSERTFAVRTVDWARNSVPGRTLSVEFASVSWQPRTSDAPPGELPEYEKILSPLARAQVTTSEDGSARLAFTPQQSGIYQVTLRGDGAVTELLFWVGGEGSGLWPRLPNNRLNLSPDKDTYQAGDTARVFVPNPFGVAQPILVTLERSSLHYRAVQTLPAGGGIVEVPIGEAEAPNIYLTITLPGQRPDGSPDFRYGIQNLPVAPQHLTLRTEILDVPPSTAPGTQVSLRLHVSDSQGAPVQGEFSLAVVDKAALALSEPNSQPITATFYGRQPLGIHTGIGLAAYVLRGVESPGGMGGGGGGAVSPPLVRQNFPDTAYWQADILTDANGEAVVTFEVPDSLTTWVLDLRGVTRDTLVGQAQAELVVNKPLLLRPVTPRFVTLGDHFPLAAVVHNQSGEKLQISVQLQAPAFRLDDPAQAVQVLTLETGERARVDWWGTVTEADSLEAVFSAEGGRWSDATGPVWGALPIVRYAAPQVYATSGTLSEAGSVLESVSLPRGLTPLGGDLQVEVAPSLAASMLPALETLEHQPYECVEQTLSRFLPNLAVYRVATDFGLSSPDLEARLQRTLDVGVEKLLQAQHEDGGWGWWPEERNSDPYITTYVLFGLLTLQQEGISDLKPAIEAASAYLMASLFPVDANTPARIVERQAFTLFVLQKGGIENPLAREQLYALRERLSPASKAYLALAYPPDSQQANTLLENLQATAIRSATTAHWEAGDYTHPMQGSNTQHTAVVLYALAQREPASPLLPPAVRYLITARGSRSWASTYESAWSILALTEAMRGTGELAGNFDFQAALNGAPLLSGNASGQALFSPVRSRSPLSELYPDAPNALSITRGAGSGNLYYRAYLNLLLPASELPPLSQGLSVERRYFLPGETHLEQALHSASRGELLEVHLTLVVPHEVYYAALEDFFPAGAEVLDSSLKTSQQPPASEPDQPLLFTRNWGRWLFGSPQIFDDHIAWSAKHLPPGTYELTYTLVLTQPGEYRVLPAHAFAFYAPEVQGRSAGEIFTITP